MTTETQTAAIAPVTKAPAEAPSPPAKVMAPPDTGGAISAFASASNFEQAVRMAKALASSNMVPAAYQGSIPNVMIALELASRVGASVFSVMQSLDIIHGKPGWSSKFLIATVNASGKFTKLRFRFEGTEGQDDWGCRCVAKSLEDDELCVGPKVTIGIAKAEGWHGKTGSKWKTMPELMLCYRAAAFWTRLYCPELSLGMRTSEETVDVEGYALPDVKVAGPVATKALEAALLGVVPPAPGSEPKAPPAPESGPEAKEQPKLVGEQPLVDLPAKAKKAKAEKPQPIQDIDPETGEIVPPPNAGDAWEPEAPR